MDIKSYKLIFFLFLISFLFAKNCYSVSAPYFTTDTEAGETQFRSDVTSANSSAEFFEFPIISSTSSYPISVTGSNGTVVYVKVTRGGSNSAITTSVSHSGGHDGNSTLFFEDFTVNTSGNNWDQVVTEGVKFEFFSDSNMSTPTTVNAFGTFTHHWGTCCVSSNITPTGTAAGTAVYAVYGTSGGTTSTNRIGNITSSISPDVHFVALIDDSNSFNHITLVPNGHGEAFKVGGYLLFSKVPEGSVPEGTGYTPSVPPDATFNPVNGATGVSKTSSITINITEPIRNSDNTALTNTNVDDVITLKDTNSSGLDISFDATINDTKTTITITPSSNFTAGQTVYAAISNSVEDEYNNTLSSSSSTFTIASVGTPSASISPANGSSGISNSTDIVITFDEPVRIISGDTTLTDTNVDALITLKKTNAQGADIAFDATINSDKTTITINPTSNFSSNQVVYAALGATLEDLDNNAAAGIISKFSTTSSSSVTLTNPLEKPDVIAMIDSYTNLSTNFAMSSINTIDSRLSWLDRNKNSSSKSNQGIRLVFDNKLLERVINENYYGNNFKDKSSDLNEDIASSEVLIQDNDINFESANNIDNNYLQNVSYLSGREAEKKAAKDTIELAVKKIVELKNNKGININPSYGNIYKDWSIWTSGEINLSSINLSAESSQQKNENNLISIGVDKPMKKEGLIGAAFIAGTSDINIGTSLTSLNSNNYGLMGYRTYNLSSGNKLKFIGGLGIFDIKTIRADGSENLKGERNANQLYGLIGYNNPLNNSLGDWEISSFSNFKFIHTVLGRYSESGGDNALIFGKENNNKTFISTGLDIKSKHIFNNKFVPFIKLEYGLDISKASNSNIQYVNESASYNSKNKNLFSSFISSNIGSDIYLGDFSTGIISYEFQNKTNYSQSHILKFTLNYSF